MASPNNPGTDERTSRAPDERTSSAGSSSAGSLHSSKPSAAEVQGDPRPPWLWPWFGWGMGPGFAFGGPSSNPFLESFYRMVGGGKASAALARDPQWATSHRIALELPSMRLRDFSRAPDMPPTLICGPYALHGANVADFAPGCSVVETLMQAGIAHLLITDWRSATPAMRLFTIDTFLADLNVAVDELLMRGQGPVNLIGICQGGWLAFVYALRFPEKIAKLVIAGAPIDIAAAQSDLSRMALNAPREAYDHLVRLGDGVVEGARTLRMWSTSVASQDAAEVLQLPATITDAQRAALIARFQDWNNCTVDLPGVYYLEVVEQLFRENRIARGEFVALGRKLDLTTFRKPLYLLAGRDDRVVAPQQLFAVAERVATPRADIREVEMPCGHLSLFMGHAILAEVWPEIARWLRGLPPVDVAET